jgi:hypothetical protein
MNINTLILGHWDGFSYVVDHTEAHDHAEAIALCCGASSAQNQIQTAQTNAYTQMTQQASQVFGQDSAVFNDLMNSFAPIVAAGPSQQGFSAQQLASLNSQAITQTGINYNNAKQAVGEAESAQGGGNAPDVTGGAKIATDLGIATSAAQQTSSEENQIAQANWAQGNENYKAATSGLLNSTNAFNSATSANNATTGSGSAAANTANEIASQNNSWVQGVTGALGSIAGGVVSGGMSNLGKGVGFFG